MCTIERDDHHGPGTVPSDNFDVFTVQRMVAINNFRSLWNISSA
jgi:hypothetical protein